MNFNSAKLSLAPMLDMTDKHFRYLCRIMCKNMLLYSELTTTGAILYGKNDFLEYSTQEHPIALQLGGADPSADRKSTRLNSSHQIISYAVFCLKKKKKIWRH